MYLGDGRVIDTDAFRRVRVHNISEFKEFKAKRYPNLTPQAFQKITGYLFKQMDKPYDWMQIAGFFVEAVFGWKNTWQLPETYTCGKLVDLAFLEAGIDLLPGWENGDVTPRDLWHSPFLVDVNEDI